MPHCFSDVLYTKYIIISNFVFAMFVFAMFVCHVLLNNKRPPVWAAFPFLFVSSVSE